MTTPRYNDHFATEADARLAWGAFAVLRDGIDTYADKPLPTFPGDKPVYAGNTVSGARGGFFADVKNAVPVAELAGRFTTLTPAGPGKLRGKCPLHEEKTGSFYVYQDSNRWQCFGACATGGDVINLAQCLMDKGLLQ